MKKRILSIMLLCCMVLTLLPVTAFATGELRDSTNVTVTFDSDGGSAVEPQSVPQGQLVQRPATPTKDGYTFIGWYNKADLQYINLPEWNFDYPVFENLELVAQWMEARPISTDPITYLDKDGNQQVCTAYTVLTSETKESILNYDDKWYDLPAGWYVVKGDVTFTPRLDTHGAVNLILTNGSHLTAEWGIDVKVGDTFTVYAQSTDEGTMGRLTACLPADFNLDRMVDYSVWPYYGMAGIGSSARWRAGNDGIRESEGTIIINGGNIRAKGQDNASAIGGTRAEEIEFRSTDRDEVYNRRQGGSITINGGVVRTEAFAMSEGNCTTVVSVGIGTCQMGYGGSVTINGGTVIAEATCDAITTGYGGTITINGGDVTAIGGVNNFAEDLNRVIPGNGIGPYESGSVIINGGTVKATAKGEGFGIGGARIYNTGAMTVTINGGTIEATANHNNAAIGDKGIGKSGVTINGGVIHAVGKGSAAGIGSKGDIRITGGELTVSAEGSGAAIGGFTDSNSERVNCKSITINGDVIQSISSKDGACIGGAAGGSVGSITISDAELPLLSSNKILIGWDADSPGGKLTIQNSRVESTDIPTTHTDGIRVGSNSEIVIENSEIRLPHLRGIRVGGNGSIAVRDSDLHTYGIFMDENAQSPNDAKTLKKLEITGSTVLTGDIIGARGDYTSVEEVVIHGSSIRLNDEYTYNYCTIGGGTRGSFGSIDIQNSQIHIPSPGLNTSIGNGHQAYFNRESRIRIANSQVFVGGAKFGPAIGAAYGSSGGQINILIENSTVTAKGGNLRSDTDYIPGIGKNSSGRASEIGKIQILNSTVESFRLEEKDGTNYVYDDLHTKELPGIPAENISICGSTVNGKTIAHSFDEYGKCTLCGKYDLGYCYEHGLLTMEGLTDCVSDGSEKKLTGLSHQTGENETKQLAENTDYTASYSNNVHPYTLKPDDAGFDPEKAPKVTLYGTGNYCGKAEHYFTISENAAAPTITTSSLPNGKVGEAYSEALTADGTEPITWSISGGALPDGLTLNETTGEISGTPTADGTAKFTVKAENNVGSDTKELSITITKDAPAEFTITVTSSGNGTASASLAKAAAGTEITLTATPKEGYHFKEWQVISGNVTIKDNKFTMPDSDVEVKAIFEKDAPPAPTEFTITVKTDGNGTASASHAKAAAGTEITLTATPNKGYHFKEWQVESPAGLVITNNKFTMPDTNVAIKAIFEEDAPPAPTEFTITVKTDGNGTASASHAKAVVGTEITLTAKPNKGYHFKEWEVISGGVTIKNNKFIMPSANVEVKAIFEEDAPPVPTDPAKPNISVTGTYTYNGSVHTATVSGYDPTTMDISGNTATEAGDYTVRVTSKTGKWADGSTGAVTAAWSIGKATQEAPNGLIGVAPTTEGGSDGKISGVTDKMEYRMADGSIYTACSGTEIENLSAGNYFVRYAEDNNHFAGPDVAVTVGEGAPPADCTITFNGNGGSGSMEPVTVKAETNYILPECGFTAPADQEFKAWEIGGTEYKVGDSYTVLVDTEIKALWENSVITPTTYTVTVSNDGNGTASASHAKAAAGTEITLTATPQIGYHFKGWQVESPAGLVITNNKFTMPDGNVDVKAIFEKDAPPAPTEFIVTFDGNGGTPSVGSMTTTDRKLTSLPSASRSGSYSFYGWYTEKSGGTKITTDTVFHANATVYAHWTYTGGGGGDYNPPVTYYTLRFETGGGSDIPSVQGTYNTYIDLTKYVPTWRGHAFIGWYSERSLTNKVSGVCLTKDMTVYAGWRMDENPGTGVNPFTDISEKDWFYGDVMFVYENGLMLGTSKTLFSPHGTAMRGMMATILWRMEGSPVPKGKNSFTDVEAGKWYADAITWTTENGIFAGYGKDKFFPDDPITREQLAAIFYRYADYKGYDLTVKGDLDKFKDADKITDYAKTAMQWAVGSGLVKGKSGNLLDPQGTATRAEIAAMLHRFIEKYELVQGKAPGGLMGWIDPKRLQIPKTGDSSV